METCELCLSLCLHCKPSAVSLCQPGAAGLCRWSPDAGDPASLRATANTRALTTASAWGAAEEAIGAQHPMQVSYRAANRITSR